MKAIAILALGVCGTAMLGCQQIGMAPPDVALSDIRLTKLTAFETSAEVHLRVTNPNRIPLLIAGSVHKLVIDGKAIGSATANTPFRVEPMSSEVQRCELNMSNLAMVTQLRAILEQRRFDYAIASTIHLVDGLLPLTVNSTGKFDAPE